MALGTLGKMMRTTRTQMIRSSVATAAEECAKRFGLQDGDYIQFQRWNNVGKLLPTIGRIVLVDACWANGAGGYTAQIKVAPLLQSGSLGNTRTLHICVNKRGDVEHLGPRGPVRKVDMEAA